MAALSERTIYAAFRVSIILKGANALLEVFSALVIAFVKPASVTAIVTAIVHRELIEDPTDRVAGWLLHAAQSYSVSGQRFMVYYLISHGVLKLAVVAGLLANKHWAYPAGLVVLGLFILYQFYRMTYAPSLGLTLLTAFDLVVMVLIWHEYRRVRHHLPVG
jgi:uncharacterized membrane protein